MLIKKASYSAPSWPKARSSSNITVTFMPFGVPNEYSCIGCLPTGNSFSCVAPEIGLFMFANLPPFLLSHFQTFGGVYCESDIFFPN